MCACDNRQLICIRKLKTKITVTQQTLNYNQLHTQHIYNTYVYNNYIHVYKAETHGSAMKVLTCILLVARY